MVRSNMKEVQMNTPHGTRNWMKRKRRSRFGKLLNYWITYSLRSSLRIRFWFSSWIWCWLLNLTLCCCLPLQVLMLGELAMTSLTEHFWRSFAVVSPMGSFARFDVFLWFNSIKILPLCVTIQLDFGMCSQLWLLYDDLSFDDRFGCERNTFGFDTIFLLSLLLQTLLLVPLKSRDKHSSIAVIHFEAVRLSSHRY